jgi:ferric-dicitrate binding protein FerR (iron transport regulator)
MDVKVLGTVFNVKAYPGDKITETSLIKGSVEVTLNSGARKKVILHPNEKIILPNDLLRVPVAAADEPKAASAETDKYRITGLTYNVIDSTLAEVSWTENRIVFNENSLDEIATELERWYSVSIRFEDEAVRKYRFTAVFDRKNITQVLDALQLSRPFEYKIENDNKIVIRK